MMNRAVIGEYLERLNTNAGVNGTRQLNTQLFHMRCQLYFLLPQVKSVFGPVSCSSLLFILDSLS